MFPVGCQGLLYATRVTPLSVGGNIFFRGLVKAKLIQAGSRISKFTVKLFNFFELVTYLGQPGLAVAGQVISLEAFPNGSLVETDHQAIKPVSSNSTRN